MTQVSEVSQVTLDIQEVRAHRVKGVEGYVASVHSWSCSLLKMSSAEKYLSIFFSINFNKNFIYRIFLLFFFCRVLMVKMVYQVFQVETVNEARLDHLGHLDSQVLRVVQGLLDPLAHLDQLESVEKG